MTFRIPEFVFPVIILIISFVLLFFAFRLSFYWSFIIGIILYILATTIDTGLRGQS